jgi:uracil-DNA glycosylase
MATARPARRTPTPRPTRRGRREAPNATAAEARIRGTHVPARFPARGDVTAIIYGEAPGPRGADKSGIPFFGDKSGRLVYDALIELGRCTVNVDLDSVPWDGIALHDAGAKPTMIGTALSNAYPVCPSNDGHSFRAPTKKELASEENVARVRAEIAKAKKRGLATVVTLGRHADWLLGTHIGLREDPAITYHQIVHPSPLGLIWLARKQGAGVRLADVAKQWKARFEEMLGPA